MGKDKKSLRMRGSNKNKNAKLILELSFTFSGWLFLLGWL